MERVMRSTRRRRSGFGRALERRVRCYEVFPGLELFGGGGGEDRGPERDEERVGGIFGSGKIPGKDVG